MSVVGNNRVGIPIVVLHDAEGAVVEVETKNGQLIRGLLFEAEDQMNLYLKNCVITGPDGVKRKTPQLYLRGCEIVFICLPEMLQHAPMFQRIKHWRKHAGAPPEGVGKVAGQAAAILRKATERRQGGGFRGRGGGRFDGRGRFPGRFDGGRGGPPPPFMGGRGGPPPMPMGRGGYPGPPPPYPPGPHGGMPPR